jgi:hypothetical protein
VETPEPPAVAIVVHDDDDDNWDSYDVDFAVGGADQVA